MPLVAAFQGEHGAYSEQAVHKFASETMSRFDLPSQDVEVKVVPCQSFEACFTALIDNEVDCIVLPIENTLGGSLYDNYQGLSRNPTLHIVGECIVKINHCLLAIPGSDIKYIQKAYSHPQALIQSRKFLDSSNIQAVEYYDTAGAAKYIATLSDPTIAAVASELAAKTYNLEILQHSIQDISENYTRFFCITRKSISLKDLVSKMLISKYRHETLDHVLNSVTSATSNPNSTLVTKALVSLGYITGLTTFMKSAVSCLNQMTNCEALIRKCDIRPISTTGLNLDVSRIVNANSINDDGYDDHEIMSTSAIQGDQFSYFPYICYLELESNCKNKDTSSKCPCFTITVRKLLTTARYAVDHGEFFQGEMSQSSISSISSPQLHSSQSILEHSLTTALSSYSNGTSTSSTPTVTPTSTTTCKSLTPGYQSLSTRALATKPSVTAEITELASQMRRDGIDVYSLSVGEPADMPYEVIGVVNEALSETVEQKMTKYTPTAGTLELRRLVADIYNHTIRNHNMLQMLHHLHSLSSVLGSVGSVGSETVSNTTKSQFKEMIHRDPVLLSPRELSPSQICISNGAKQALYQVLLTLCDPNDIILIPSPCWVSYTEMCNLIGCQYKLIETTAENDYKLQLDDLKRAMYEIKIENEIQHQHQYQRRQPSRIRGLLICNPNNPTGALYTTSELQPLVDYLFTHAPDSVLISDEIYEHLVHSNNMPSLLRMESLVSSIETLATEIASQASTSSSLSSSMSRKDQNLVRKALTSTSISYNTLKNQYYPEKEDAVMSISNVELPYSSAWFLQDMRGMRGMQGIQGKQDEVTAVIDATDATDVTDVTEVTEVTDVTEFSPENAKLYDMRDISIENYQRIPRQVTTTLNSNLSLSLSFNDDSKASSTSTSTPTPTSKTSLSSIYNLVNAMYSSQDDTELYSPYTSTSTSTSHSDFTSNSIPEVISTSISDSYSRSQSESESDSDSDSNSNSNSNFDSELHPSYNSNIDRIIIVSGFSKGFGMTGFRIGYSIAPTWLSSHLVGIQSQITSCASSVSQYAAMKVLQIPNIHSALKYERMMLYNKLTMITNMIRRIPHVKFDYKPKAAFYAFVNIEKTFGLYTGKSKRQIQNSIDFCTFLLQDNLVALVPGDAFYGPKCVRIVYALREDYINEALFRVFKFCNALTEMP